jgi:diacylglycerol kinase (ATP)
VLVVTNARSRENRRDPGLAGRLAAQLGARGRVCAPEGLEALRDEMGALHAAPPDVLAVHGGDGTLHRVITAWLSTGETPLPEILVLRGGTMNIVADSVGLKARAEVALEAAFAPAGHAVRTLLRLEVDGAPVWGFLAGNGIVARFLEKYYRKEDPTPIDAARLLARGAASAMVGGTLIRELVRPWVGSVEADGEDLGERPWTAIAVGSVEQMGLGFRVFSRLRGDGAFHVVALSSSVAGVARELPRLWAGKGVARPGNRDLVVRELVLRGVERMALMVDGDFHRAESGVVRIVPGPPVRFVLP